MRLQAVGTALHRMAIVGAIPVLGIASVATAPPAAAAIACADLGGTSVGTDAATGRTICQVDFTGVGTTPWTVPSTVTVIQAVTIGGGGGGGGAAANNAGTSAGGGGGGGVVGSSLTVSPGQTYTISVGAGGQAGSGATLGTGGGTSQITGPGGTVITGGGARGDNGYNAYGGYGGTSGGGYAGGALASSAPGDYPNIGSGGGGGAGASGSAAAVYNLGYMAGGAGGAGVAPSSLAVSWFSDMTTRYGGGGGGGAFAWTSGAAAGAGTDGGGAGGCFDRTTPCGSGVGAGTSYGAGGGGAAVDANSAPRTGGNGYQGRVIVRFLLPSPPEAPTITSVSPVLGSTSSLDVAFTLGASALAYTDVQYSLDGGAAVSMGRTTAGTYRITGLTAGQSYAVRVFGVSSAGTSPASSAVSQSPYAVTPTFTSGASVSGNAWVGQVLTGAATASGTPTPTVSYQWYTCDAAQVAGVALPAGCTAIGGASASSYTVQSGDFGAYLLVRAEASNSGGGITTTTDSFSATTAAVIRTPAAPTLDSVTASGTTTVSVVASLPADTGGSAITGVDYSTNNGTDWTATGGASGTFTIAGLSGGTTYQVKVRARNAAGAGTASTATSVTTYVGPAVTSAATLSGTAAQGRTLTGSDAAFSGVPTPTLARAWYACASAHVAAGATVPADCSAIAGSTGTTLSVGAAQVGTYIAYVVTGTNLLSSATSVSATVGPVIGLASAPTLTSVSAATTTSMTVVASLGATGGQVTDVEYSLDSGAWTSSGQTMGSFTITGLTPGTSYSVRVRTVNDAGASPASNSIAQSPFAVGPAFTAAASVSGSAQVGATLTASATLTGTPTPTLTYQWFSCDATHASGGALPAGCVAISAQVGATLVVPSAQYQARILVRVRATNAGGETTNTLDSYSATTTAVIDAPGAPGLSATDAVATPGRIDVAVTAPDARGSAITGYQYSLNPGAGSPTWTDVTVTGSTATITGLSNGTAYDVAVRAVNAVGAGPASSTVVVTPMAAPSSATGTRSDGAIDVAWAAPSGGGATGYRVQVRTDPAGVWADASGGCAPATTTVTTARTCTAGGLTNGVAYNVRVAAVNANGQASYSAPSAAVTPLSRVDTLAAMVVETSASSVGPFSAIGLTPSFSSGTLAYTAVVANAIGYAAVTPTESEAGQAILVDGVSVSSGATSASIPLAVGTTTITITVQSVDRVTHADSPYEQDYVVTISRAAPNGGSGGGGSGGASTPTVPPRDLGPRAPEGGGLLPGAFTVTEDGRPQSVRVSAGSGNTSLDVVGSSWSLELGGRTPAGEPVPLGPSGILRLLMGTSLYAAGSGYEPNSWIRIYLMSEPELMGSFLTDGHGSFTGVVPLPAGTIAGSHTVQVNGYATSGDVRSFSLGIEVVRPTVVASTVGTKVYFRYSSARLTAAARAALRALVAQVPADSVAQTVVVGGRRGSGATEADRALARARARATTEFLRTAGLTGQIVTTTRPIAVQNTVEDRRVTVTVALG